MKIQRKTLSSQPPRVNKALETLDNGVAPMQYSQRCCLPFQVEIGEIVSPCFLSKFLATNGDFILGLMNNGTMGQSTPTTISSDVDIVHLGNINSRVLRHINTVPRSFHQSSCIDKTIQPERLITSA